MMFFEKKTGAYSLRVQDKLEDQRALEEELKTYTKEISCRGLWLRFQARLPWDLLIKVMFDPFYHYKSLLKHHVSSVQNPGWLFDIGDYTTQLYGDYFISQYKDPVINQPVFHGMSTGFSSLLKLL